MTPLRIFIGYDERSALAYNILQHSIQRHASKPVAITPLRLSTLPLKRRGLTEFTYSRFLVPFLSGYRGPAVFMDSDIVVTGDIAELFDCADGRSAVQVNKQQPRFEWPSVMLFNTDLCEKLTPPWVDDESNNPYNLDSWAEGFGVGEFPPIWNQCVGYMEPTTLAKLYHYTQGVPEWAECRGLVEDGPFFAEKSAAMHIVPWVDLMGASVHAKAVMERFLGRYQGAINDQIERLRRAKAA